MFTWLLYRYIFKGQLNDLVNAALFFMITAMTIPLDILVIISVLLICLR